MKLSQFKFNLPKELLAESPSKNRDEARLMVVNRKTGKIEHKLFKDVLGYFNDGDCMILNDTKVFPARMYGNKEKTGAKIEVFLLRELNAESRLWDVLVDPARKIRIGNKLYFGDDDTLVAEVIDNTTSRGRTLRFLFDGSYDEFRKTLQEMGETPLPKYIKRAPTEEDKERYQTVYAKNEGAVAAPTAIGTTTMRAIETSVSTEGFVKPYNGWTNKFIFPPYDFSVANCMITNFHTPESTLLMMVCAFGGYDLMMKAYKEAIKEKYRFYTYGDAMLIL